MPTIDRRVDRTPIHAQADPLTIGGMPLAGKRILITRTRQQASELAAALQAKGAETILVPTIELQPPASFCALDAALACLRSFDWVIFTSANAVQAFAARAQSQGILPHPQRVAVIGPATARAVEAIGLAADLVPPEFVAESLAHALLPYAAGAAMLLVRAEQARDVLPDTLQQAGAQLTIATAYRTVVPAASSETLRQLFSNPALYPDAITFTSSSTAANLFALLEAAGIALPQKIVRASIGPVTSRTLDEVGYPATREAVAPTIDSLVELLQGNFEEEQGTE